MQFLQLYLALWLGMLGAAVGSFFDCAVSRGTLPRGRSRCDSCGHILGAKDLIPILSYGLNRGQCRYCGCAIPVRCLGAEIAGAVLFAVLGIRFGFTLELIMQLVLGSLLLLLSLTDWTTHLLPDRILLAAVINRLAFMFFLGQPLKETIISMVIGGFSVSLPLLFLSLAMDRLLQKETMGGGDIKLLFVLGLYLNWLQMILLLFVACALALIWAFCRRKSCPVEIPFGPFLATAWFVVTLIGTSWTQWYFALLR